MVAIGGFCFAVNRTRHCGPYLQGAAGPPGLPVSRIQAASEPTRAVVRLLLTSTASARSAHRSNKVLRIRGGGGFHLHEATHTTGCIKDLADA